MPVGFRPQLDDNGAVIRFHGLLGSIHKDRADGGALLILERSRRLGFGRLSPGLPCRVRRHAGGHRPRRAGASADRIPVRERVCPIPVLVEQGRGLVLYRRRARRGPYQGTGARASRSRRVHAPLARRTSVLDRATAGFAYHEQPTMRQMESLPHHRGWPVAFGAFHSFFRLLISKWRGSPYLGGGFHLERPRNTRACRTTYQKPISTGIRYIHGSKNILRLRHRVVKDPYLPPPSPRKRRGCPAGNSPHGDGGVGVTAEFPPPGPCDGTNDRYHSAPAFLSRPRT